MELIDGSKSKQSIKCIIVHHQCRWPCVSCTVICSLNANHNYKTLSGSAFYNFYNYSLCYHCTYMHVLSCWCHSWCTLLDWCLYCCAAILPVVINETGHAVILTKFPALVAPEVVDLPPPGTVNDDSFIEMTFLCQWCIINVLMVLLCLVLLRLYRELLYRGLLGAVSIRKTVLPGMAIPMLKIRRPNGRLIFNMEIVIRR